MIDFRNIAVGTKAGAAVAVAGAGLAPVASAQTPQVDLKVLLLGTSTTQSDYEAWAAALQREGIPFDTIVGPDHTPITSSTLSDTAADGNPEGKYEAIIVSVGDLIDCSTGTCVSDLSTSEWSAIESYEETFGVRQITGDVYPSSSYGLNSPTFSGTLDGTEMTLTSDGASDFPYLQSAGTFPIDTGTYGYEATPASTKFDPFVSGPNGSALAGIYTDTNGVQDLVETYAQNPYQLQDEFFRHGALAWATRGVYFGDQHNYLGTDIDDSFLSDDSWDTATNSTDFIPADALRMQPTDVDYAASWSAQNKLRIDQLFNGDGSVEWANGCTVASSGDGGSGGTTTGCAGTAPGTDPLLAEYQKDDPATGSSYADDFGWINHTWDDQNLDQGCASQNYIEAEVQANTNWAAQPPGSTLGNPNTGGLGLTSTKSSTAMTGSQNPGIVVTGAHSGLANLLPGNPGDVDPPDIDQATVSTTAGTLPAGTYTWAITDQFTPGGGESTASETTETLSAPGELTLQWQAVCHASDYNIYREVAGSNDWSLLTTISAPSTPPPNSSFADPTSTTNVAGGGAQEQDYTDTGTAGTASTGPPSTNGAVETAYEQNTNLDAAFTAIGITAFGADSTKPYPDPADSTFTTGSPPSAQFAADQTFADAGAQAVPRYPTNIYYNASTEAQEVDEYNYLYLPPPNGVCVSSSTTTCLSSPATFAQIIASVDQGMFENLMGNDPRPTYFYQSNLMGQPPAGPPTTGTPPDTSPGVGDGLFYSTLNQLLSEYNSYFDVPIEQPSMEAIAQLLAEQSGWAANTQVSGYIQGNTVTVTNGASAPAEIPLTGVPAVGSVYGASGNTQSGWTSAPAGTSTYTASTSWPGT